MKIYLRAIEGIPAAITSMFFSKRSWTPELEDHVYEVCDRVLDRHGFYVPENQKKPDATEQDYVEYNKWMTSLLKFGRRHITMLRYIDFTFVVEGLHRAGQDDWDSHAKRFENRIIRSSTRLASFNGDEMSDWYKPRILTTDQALKLLGITLPDQIAHDGKTYTRAVNGYVVDDVIGTKEEQDTRRGLYMECIPSNFIYKCNLTEWAHVFKERNAAGTANPEVKLCCEVSQSDIHSAQPLFTRDLMMEIKN